MLRLLALALCASAALAAPGTLSPRLFKWNCPQSECQNYLLQGTDSCYKYCVSGTCDVRGVDCLADCGYFCNNNCDDIAAELPNQTPVCKTGLPQNVIQKPPINPNSFGIDSDYTIPTGTLRYPVPVTNPDSLLPGSDNGESVALVPLPEDGNALTDPAGTIDLGVTLPPTDDNTLQTADLSAGFSENPDITAFSPGGTDPNLLGDDTFSVANNEDPGLVALNGSPYDFNNNFGFFADGADIVASNDVNPGYEDFIS